MAGCITPFTIIDKLKGSVPVPCGRCPPCLSRRISNWSKRLMEEDKVSSSSYFLTLTYNNEHVKLSDNNFLTLCKRDIQLFIKRLRKAHPKTTRLKYYLVGEYGGRFNRPHYHIILFNAQLNILVGKDYEQAIKRGEILLNGKHEFYSPLWGVSGYTTNVYGTKKIKVQVPPVYYGHFTIGEVSNASVGYTLSYVSKGGEVPKHDRDDRKREFSLMSKGLGKNYLTREMVTYHLADIKNRMYCNVEDGKKISMPRYYKNQIYTEEQRKYVGSHQRQIMELRAINARTLEGSDYEKNKVQRDLASFKRLAYKNNQQKAKNTLL